MTLGGQIENSRGLKSHGAEGQIRINPRPAQANMHPCH